MGHVALIVDHELHVRVLESTHQSQGRTSTQVKSTKSYGLLGSMVAGSQWVHHRGARKQPPALVHNHDHTSKEVPENILPFPRADLSGKELTSVSRCNSSSAACTLGDPLAPTNTSCARNTDGGRRCKKEQRALSLAASLAHVAGPYLEWEWESSSSAHSTESKTSCKDTERSSCKAVRSPILFLTVLECTHTHPPPPSPAHGPPPP